MWPKGVPKQGPEYLRPQGLQQEERGEQATFSLLAPRNSCWGREEVGEEWKLQHSLRPCASRVRLSTAGMSQSKSQVPGLSWKPSSCRQSPVSRPAGEPG